MKGLLYISLIVCVLGTPACGRKGQPKENPVVFGIDTALKKTAIRFAALEHDFGKVNEGTELVHVYELLNTGDADLLLHEVKPSCGCTTPEYDKKPIRPGKKGSVKVTFNTKGRPGRQHKTVVVTANTEPANTVLSFTCEVMPAEK